MQHTERLCIHVGRNKLCAIPALETLFRLFLPGLDNVSTSGRIVQYAEKSDKIGMFC